MNFNAETSSEDVCEKIHVVDFPCKIVSCLGAQEPKIWIAWELELCTFEELDALWDELETLLEELTAWLEELDGARLEELERRSSEDEDAKEELEWAADESSTAAELKVSGELSESSNPEMACRLVLSQAERAKMAANRKTFFI